MNIAAIGALCKSENDKYVQELSYIYENDTNWEVRVAVAKGFAHFKPNSVKDSLFEMTRDEQWWVRFNAIKSIVAMGEEATIIDNVNSLLELSYPEFEIIVVNDGSKDSTLLKMIEHFKLRKIDAEINIQVECNKINGVYGSFEIPHLVVVDKKNGGKSDALNAGINVSRYPLFCGIDADCIIEKDALLRIVKPFLKNEKTIAAGGIVRIANGCTIRDGKLIKAGLPRQAIVIFQIVEYFRAFLTSRIGWERINTLLIISGTFGVFKKSAVVKVGGYSKTIGEDMELTLKMHEYFRKNKIPYKIDFASDAVCWTQAPDTLKGLKTQHRGLTDSLLRHKNMLFNPRYGTVGLLSIPYFLFVEMLGPVIEVFGYVMLFALVVTGHLSKFFIFVFLMAFSYGILFSFCAILFEQFSYKRYSNVKEVTKLAVYSLFEQFLYRQMTVWWRRPYTLRRRKSGFVLRKGFLRIRTAA